MYMYKNKKLIYERNVVVGYMMKKKKGRNLLVEKEVDIIRQMRKGVMMGTNRNIIFNNLPNKNGDG